MLTIPTKLLLIKSLILPIIDYMDIVNDPYESRRCNTINNKIEKLLDTSVRFVYKLKKSDYITEHMNKSGLVVPELVQKFLL